MRANRIPEGSSGVPVAAGRMHACGLQAFKPSRLALACASALIAFGTAHAVPVVQASFGLDFPVSAYGQWEFPLGSGLYGLSWTPAGSTPALPGYGIAVQSTQAFFSSGGAATVSASVVTANPSGGGVLVLHSGGGVATANVQGNSVTATATGNRNELARDSGGATLATVDLGTMATGKTVGAVSTQFFGVESGGSTANARAAVSGEAVGALYDGMNSSTIAVTGNSIGASTTLNQSTQLVAGAVPLGYADSEGGSSTISINGIRNGSGGVADAAVAGSVAIGTLQATFDAGISAGTNTNGSAAQVTGSQVALKTQHTASPNQQANPLSLNENTVSASFAGNSAANLFVSEQSAQGAATHSFTGSVSVTNAQLNLETKNYAPGDMGPTAQVSNSRIIADLTYAGVGAGSGASATQLTGSLSVSGTQASPQSISAQAAGNLAGTVGAAGNMLASGNAIVFTNPGADVTGSASPTGAYVDTTHSSSSGGLSQVAQADLVINSAQVNESVHGLGVGAMVSGSGITAAIDNLAASAAVTMGHNAVTAGAAGNAAGNLIDVTANNVAASMAIANSQLNLQATVGAANLGSTIGVGAGMSTGGYSGEDLAAATAQSGSVAVDHNSLGAVAQGNLAANAIRVQLGNTLTATQSGSFSYPNGSGSGSYVGADAGLMGLNVQQGIGSPVSAELQNGSIAARFADQAGDNQGKLVPLGAATVSLSSNELSAKAQGNAAGTTLAVTGGTAASLTAQVANAQSLTSSPVTATVSGSSALVSAWTVNGATVHADQNVARAEATGNAAVNAASVTGTTSIDSGGSFSGSGTWGLVVDNEQRIDGTGAVSAGVIAVDLGALVGASGGNTGLGNFPGIDAATMSVNGSQVEAAATGNRASNSGTLSGTQVGSASRPVEQEVFSMQGIGSAQGNGSANPVTATVAGANVGVRLQGQLASSSMTAGNTDSPTTSNPYSYGEDTYLYSAVTNATATGNASGTQSHTSSVTAIRNSTLSVNDTAVRAAALGNDATSTASLSATNATLGFLAAANMQGNSAAINATLSTAKVGVIVGDVAGSGGSSQTATAGATIVPHVMVGEDLGSNSIQNGSASATATAGASGSFAATGASGLIAAVDGSRVGASATANRAVGSVSVSAGNLLPTGVIDGAAVEGDSEQHNATAVSSALNDAQAGVLVGNVAAAQTSSATGNASTAITVNGASGASSTMSGSGTASAGAQAATVALGIDASTISSQSGSFAATSVGNESSNSIAFSSTKADSDVAPLTAFQLSQQKNLGNISAAVSGGMAGVLLGNVQSTASATATDAATVTNTLLAPTAGSVGGAGQGVTTTGAATATPTATASAQATGLRATQLTMAKNDMAAAAFGNSAANTISATGNTTLGVATASGGASLQIQHFQTNGEDDLGYNNVTATLANAAIGAVLGDVAASDTANASGSAANTVSMVSSSYQNLIANGIAATNTQTASGGSTATAIGGLDATVGQNSLRSAATGNAADNRITLDATAFAGHTNGNTPSINIGSGQTQAGSVSGSVSGASIGVGTGTVSASTTMSASGSASAGVTATNTSADDLASANNLTATASGNASGGATATGVSGSNLALNGNAITATARGNAGTNLIQLDTTSTAAAAPLSAQVSDVQTQIGGVTASVDGGNVGLNIQGVTATGAVTANQTATSTASASDLLVASASGGAASASGSATSTVAATGLAGSNVTVADNRVAALAGGNLSTNVILGSGTSLASVAGSTGLKVVTGQTSSPGGEDGDPANVVATVTATRLGVTLGNVAASGSASAVTTASGSATATASSTSANGQTTNAGMTATSTAGAQSTVAATGLGGLTAPVNVTVRGNEVSAGAYGNDATNAIRLTSTTVGGSTGAAPTLKVENTQTTHNNFSAQVADAVVGVSVGNVSATANASGSATATANATAQNDNATAGAGYTGNTANAVSSASGGAAASAQAKAAAIAYTHATVAGNTVSANAYGNNAANSFGLAATDLTGSTAAYTVDGSNIQVNNGTGSAALSNLTVGVATGPVTAAATATATATATDNSSAYANSAYSGGGSSWYLAGGFASGSATVSSTASGGATALGVDHATLAVSSNQLRALSVGNSADNTATLAGTQLGSAAAPVSVVVGNSQTNAGSGSATANAVRLGVFVDSVSGGASATTIGDYNSVPTSSSSAIGINASSISVGGTSDNPQTLLVQSLGNSTTNTIDVSSTTATGRAAAEPTLLANNVQTNSGVQAALIGSANPLSVVVGVAVGPVSAGASTSGGYDSTGSASAQAIVSSDINVSHNRLTALAAGNSATNTVTSSTSNALQAGLVQTANAQTNTGANLSATVRNVVVGVINQILSDQVGASASGSSSSDAASVVASTLTVDSNTLTAASFGNSATNATTVKAQTAGNGDAPLSVTTANSQTVSASTVSSKASSVEVGVGTGPTQADTATGVSGSTVAVKGNQVQAAAYGNSASNAASVQFDNTGYLGTLKTDNTQTSGATVQSEVYGAQVGLFTDDAGNGNTSLSTSPVAVQSNKVQAQSFGNYAANASSVTGGNGALGQANASSIQTNNTQTNTGAVSSKVSYVWTGVFPGTYALGGWSIASSPLSVDSNLISAISYGNSAYNTVALTAPVLGASGAPVRSLVQNVQTNSGAGSSEISNAKVGVRNSYDPLGLTNVESAVTNNALNAQAGGNTAVNQLNATATTSVAGSSTTPTFAVLNSQANTGAMNASVSNVTVGTWGPAGSGYFAAALNTGVNSVSANAYGNSANNAVAMSALPGMSNGATAAVTNAQYNTASVSATVTNALVGVGTASTGMGANGAVVAVTGNSVSASAVGNSVANHIGVSR